MTETLIFIALWCGTPTSVNDKPNVQACRERMIACATTQEFPKTQIDKRSCAIGEKIQK